jgi:hypothetical protein
MKGVIEKNGDFFFSQACLCVAWVEFGWFLEKVIRNNVKPDIFYLNFDREIYKIFHFSPETVEKP